MTPKALAQLFSYLGAVLALLAIGAWVNNRDGPNIFNYLRFDERITIDAYFAIFALSMLLIIVALAAGFYAREQPDGWLKRIPVVRFSEKFPFVTPSDSQPEDIGKGGPIAYLATTVVLVFLIPAAALFHLNRYVLYDRGRVWNAAVRSVDGAPVWETIPFLSLSAQGRAVLDSPKQNNGRADFRLADRTEDIVTEQNYVAPGSKPKPEHLPSVPCQKDTNKCTGVTWWPWLSPLLLWTLTLAAWFCTIWAFFMIFRVSKVQEEVERAKCG
jgi:hypothetical protein